MAFQFVVFVAALACANAGLIGAPVAAPVAYSPAAAVSSSYIHQAQPAAVVAHAAPVAYAAHAAPVAYAAHAAPVAYAAHAVHAPAIGASQQSVVRSLGGNQAVSHYSKAVDSAFSSVRKFDTRITNDAISVAAAPVHYAAPVAHAAYAAPVAHAAYAAPVAHAAYAAPVAHAAYATPVAHAAYAHAAPVIAKTAAVAYSPAAVVSHASFTGLGASYAW